MNKETILTRVLAASPTVLERVARALDGEDVVHCTTSAETDTRLITYTEAAKRLNISRPTVYRLVRDGRLDVVPLGGVNRITLRSVMKFASGTRH